MISTRSVERAVPPIGRFIEVDGTRLHYVERGSGQPIVMIHGLSGVLQNFTHSLVDRLASRFRIIAIDRPGAGYSQRSRGSSAHLSAQATLIAHFIAAMELQRPLVVGHSMGGAIALTLALDHPAIPATVALIAPLTQPMRETPSPFRPLEIHWPLLRGLVAYTVAMPVAALTAVQRAQKVFAPEEVPRDFATAGGGLLALRPSAFYHASSDMIAARADMPEIQRRYRELKLPVFVLFGREDALLDYRRHAEMLRDQIAGVEITLVPGGHMLPVTQPDLCATWLASAYAAARR